MKILITGGSGFIGKHLAKELCKKHKVRCFVRKTIKRKNLNYLTNLKIELFYGDILDQYSLEDAMKNIDAIFHLAGGGNVTATFKRGYEKIRELNAIATENILKTAVRFKVKKFVHFSSADVVRHEIVQKIINAYEKYEKSKSERVSK